MTGLDVIDILEVDVDTALEVYGEAKHGRRKPLPAFATDSPNKWHSSMANGVTTYYRAIEDRHDTAIMMLATLRQSIARIERLPDTEFVSRADAHLHAESVRWISESIAAAKTFLRQGDGKVLRAEGDRKADMVEQLVQKRLAAMESAKQAARGAKGGVKNATFKTQREKRLAHGLVEEYRKQKVSLHRACIRASSVSGERLGIEASPKVLKDNWKLINADSEKPASG